MVIDSNPSMLPLVVAWLSLISALAFLLLFMPLPITAATLLLICVVLSSELASQINSHSLDKTHGT